jgi:hypothetical protein
VCSGADGPCRPLRGRACLSRRDLGRAAPTRPGTPLGLGSGRSRCSHPPKRARCSHLRTSRHVRRRPSTGSRRSCRRSTAPSRCCRRPTTAGSTCRSPARRAGPGATRLSRAVGDVHCSIAADPDRDAGVVDVVGGRARVDSLRRSPAHPVVERAAQNGGSWIGSGTGAVRLPSLSEPVLTSLTSFGEVDAPGRAVAEPIATRPPG